MSTLNHESVGKLDGKEEFEYEKFEKSKLLSELHHHKKKKKKQRRRFKS